MIRVEKRLREIIFEISEDETEEHIHEIISEVYKDNFKKGKYVF